MHRDLRILLSYTKYINVMLQLLRLKTLINNSNFSFFFLIFFFKVFKEITNTRTNLDSIYFLCPSIQRIISKGIHIKLRFNLFNQQKLINNNFISNTLM